MLKIVLTEKGGEPKVLSFDKHEITIGRVQGNDVVLAKGNVSKRHSKFTTDDGQLLVEDLKSTNGTYVNGRKITDPTPVGPRDKVYVGDFIITLPSDGDEAGARRPATAPPPPPPPRAPAAAKPPAPPPARAAKPLFGDDDEAAGVGDDDAPLASAPLRGARPAPPPPPPARRAAATPPADLDDDEGPPAPDDVEDEPLASAPPRRPAPTRPPAPLADLADDEEEEEALTGGDRKRLPSAPPTPAAAPALRVTAPARPVPAAKLDDEDSGPISAPTAGGARSGAGTDMMSAEMRQQVDAALGARRNVLVSGDRAAVEAAVSALIATVPVDARSGHHVVPVVGAADASKLLVSMATGQDGFLGGLLARSPSEALARLSALARPGHPASAELVACTIDLVIQVDGTEGVRVTELAEVRTGPEGRPFASTTLTA